MLKVREAGPASGRTLLFLHGFPEFWYCWRKQIPYFAKRGFRVVVPDQRGYNESSKPPGIKAYSLNKLVKDIAELIGELGQQKVILVGHDWGAAVAWNMAVQYPHLLEKLIILNLPHPEVVKKTLLRWPPQLFRSWYIGFFQLLFIPELACKAAHFKLLEESMRQSARPGTFTEAEMENYKKAWAQAGAIKGMLNWYRAIRHSSPFRPEGIDTPTLLLWGKKDRFLSHRMARPSIEKCSNGRLIMFEEATHWLQHEEPEKINQSIAEFIG